MSVKYSWAVLLALPLPGAALVCGWGHDLCHAMTAPFRAAGDCDGSACCEQAAKVDAPKQEGKSDARPIDPGRQIVFRVEGLTCPAVKGIGCGHMLIGVLGSLDKIDGVEASFANYTGTMVRISVTPGADRDAVAGRVRKVLTEGERKAVPLAGEEFQRALDREEWRGAGRIGELSAIEFHTLALHRVKTFTKAEKLDKETADKLAAIAEQQWDRIRKQARADGATAPEDWGRHIKASLPAFLERAGGVLTAEQVERFKQTLTGQCRDDERPEAPPAPSSGKKKP